MGRPIYERLGFRTVVSTNAAINPDAPEIPGDLVDENCDGAAEQNPGPDDPDGDGIPHFNDNCPSVPNSDQADADEDGIGDICDATPNGGGIDADDDGHPAPTDCEDANPDVHPGALEIADGFDTDCDGQLAQQSAYSGPGGTEVGECQAGIQTEVAGGGWGPIVGEVLPTVEILDGRDNDCDGTIDDGF